MIPPSADEVKAATSPRDVLYKDEEKKSNSSQKAKETILGFADAFTAHGVHYIFEKDQQPICRIFWIIVVIVAGIMAILM